jgi:hypothetical protein
VHVHDVVAHCDLLCSRSGGDSSCDGLDSSSSTYYKRVSLGEEMRTVPKIGMRAHMDLETGTVTLEVGHSSTECR